MNTDLAFIDGLARTRMDLSGKVVLVTGSTSGIGLGIARALAGAPDTALLESPPDPYCGTPLGVEAAWCPNGVGLPPLAGETPMRPMEV